MYLYRLSCFLLLSINLAYSQTADSSKTSSRIIELDSVTVLGYRSKLKQLSDPINFNGNEAHAINSLQSIPGVRKTQDFGYPLVFRGLNSQRLRIEKNGAFRNGVQNQGYLLNDINPQNIESLKILTGAESVLFGSGAIGGVVQIKEKDAFNPVENNLFLGYGSNNQRRTFGLDWSKVKSKWGIRFSGRRNSSDNFYYPNNKEALNSAFEQNSLSLSSAYRNLKKQFKAVWNHDFSNGFFERPRGFQNNPFELRKLKNAFTYQTDIHIDHKVGESFNAQHDLWLILLENDQIRENFNADLTVLNQWEERKFNKDSYGYRLNLALNISSKWFWKLGADFIRNSYSEVRNTQNFINPSFSEIDSSKRVENMLGLFSLLEYRKRENTLVLSARADWAQLDNATQAKQFSAITGGLAYISNLDDQFSQTISITRKFRYPTQQEALGILNGGRGIFYGNPNLNPEFAYQLEYDLEGKLDRFFFNLSSWVSFFNNRITEVPIANNEFTYDNVERARTYGYELQVSRSFASLLDDIDFHISFSSSFIKGDALVQDRGLFSKGNPLIGIPPLRNQLALSLTKRLKENSKIETVIDLEQHAAFKRLPEGMINQIWAVQPTDAYVLSNIESSYHFPLKNHQMKISLSIRNLMNTSFYPFGARIMGMGRNLQLGLRYSF